MLKDSEISSKELDKVFEVMRDTVGVKCYGFVGRRFLNNFLCVTGKDDAKKCAEYLVENYLKINQDDLLIFDDLLKYGFCSSVSSGVVFLDPIYELWY